MFRAERDIQQLQEKVNQLENELKRGGGAAAASKSSDNSAEVTKLKSELKQLKETN